MRGKSIVIDTDFHADVDDVGALALAHAYERLGLCRIQAVVLNTPSRYGVPAVRAVNRFYGRDDIPVGSFERQDDSVNEPDYARLLSERFGRAPTPAREAVSVLRSALADAEPASVTVVSLGFLDNLARLAAESPELVERSVARTVVMGGTFPSGREFNLIESPTAAVSFTRDWPGEIEFLGWEVGSEVITGRFLDPADNPDNPVAVAYDAYSGLGIGRMSWDLQAVDLAVRGRGAPYRLSAAGTLSVEPDGSNEWHADGGAHRHAIATRSEVEIARELDDILRDSLAEVGIPAS